MPAIRAQSVAGPLFRPKLWHLAPALLLVLGLGMPLSPLQAADEERRSYQLDAGPLGTALGRVAAEAGVPLSFDPALTSGLTSPALSGDFTAREALQRLLAGSGLLLVEHADGTFALERVSNQAGAIVLDPVQVQGVTSNGITEGTGSYTTGAVSIGGRSARDPQQIQQSVSVITAQRISDQNITTAAEALTQTTGLTVVEQGNAFNPQILSRGFAVTSVQFDGGAPSYTGDLGNNAGPLPDLALYDHVEMLRGSDGLFSGAGDAGGTINLVRKRPLEYRQILVDFLSGSWDRYRGQADVTGPLGWDGRLRGRFVAAYENRHYFYEVARLKKRVLYGVLEADLTPTTLLNVGIAHEDKDDRPSYGLPLYLSGADLRLPRSTCFCTDWSYWNTTTVDYFATLEQAFSADWRLKLNLSRRTLEASAKTPAIGPGVNPETLRGPTLTVGQLDFPNQQPAADIALNGGFTAFGRKQDLVIGWNWRKYDTRLVADYFDGAPPVNVFDFDPADYPEQLFPPLPGQFINAYREAQSGVYASLRSELTSRLHSVVGVRYSDYRFDREESRLRQSGVLTPYAGITFDITDQLSLYGSFADIFKPQNAFDAAGNRLAPIRGNTYEAGLKGKWQDGRLTGSLSAYRSLRKNQSVLDFRDRTRPYSCCYIGAESQSQGIEAELSGELLTGWQLSLGYTYNDNENKSGFGSQNGARFSSYTPEHLLKLWSMLQLRGPLAAWRVGGGVNWQSKSYQTGSVCDSAYDADGECISGNFVPYDLTMSARALVGLRAEYKVNDTLTAALNFDNLFNKRYYQSVVDPWGFNFYGEPRSFMLSLRAGF